MRKVLIIGMCFVLLAVGCIKKEILVPKLPVRISINVWPGYAYAFLAQEKSFFKKNGVDVELVLKKSTPESLALFKEDRVDGCFDIFTDIVLINSQGIGAKVVCVLDYSNEGDVIIARPEIKSLVDLKDKIVGFEGVNTFSHLFVLKSLEKAGLSEADLKFVDVNAHDVLRALDDGVIEAGHTWEPTKSQALKKGYKILAKAGDIPGVIIDILAFDPQIIQGRPGDIKAVIKSLFEARNYFKSNPHESIKIMSTKSGIPEAELITGLKDIYCPDLKENLKLFNTAALGAEYKDIIDFYLKRGQLSYIPQLEDVVDGRFVKELTDK